jgi:hypothetical protein
VEGRTVGEVGLDSQVETKGGESIRGFGMKKYSVVSMMIRSRLAWFDLPFSFLSGVLLSLPVSPLLLLWWRMVLEVLGCRVADRICW